MSAFELVLPSSRADILPSPREPQGDGSAQDNNCWPAVARCGPLEYRGVWTRSGAIPGGVWSFSLANVGLALPIDRRVGDIHFAPSEGAFLYWVCCDVDQDREELGYDWVEFRLGDRHPVLYEYVLSRRLPQQSPCWSSE